MRKESTVSNAVAYTIGAYAPPAIGTLVSEGAMPRISLSLTFAATLLVARVNQFERI
jgi:hypothetical protein